jgi:hypothetical protein
VPVTTAASGGATIAAAGGAGITAADGAAGSRASTAPAGGDGDAVRSSSLSTVDAAAGGCFDCSLRLTYVDCQNLKKKIISHDTSSLNCACVIFGVLPRRCGAAGGVFTAVGRCGTTDVANCWDLFPTNLAFAPSTSRTAFFLMTFSRT